MTTFATVDTPLYVMLKPAGSLCNLACKYCYYLEKSHFYEHDARHIMSDELLERFVREYIGAQTALQVLFTWHGGEALMRPIAFYEKAIALQRKYAGGRTIENCIQTNGTMLTDEWCRFFHDNGWLVGVSIDGPQRFHDAYRKGKQGQPSFHQVMKGIELLDKHKVEWNAMAVVNNFNADYPLEFYHFFKEIGCRYIQFTPIVERLSADGFGSSLAKVDDRSKLPVADFSVTPEQWGNFLCTLFDEWVRNDVGRYYVQLFDATLANWMGVQPNICTLAKYCGHAGVMEFNGDVYSCDHFVYPQYKLGNIYNQSLYKMMYSRRQQEFGRHKFLSLPSQCRKCTYLFACNGECPKNRFSKAANGERGLNYLCRGYYRFFEHVAPYMEYMKNELLNRRAPANIMKTFQ